jgi:hypothetical protein
VLESGAPKQIGVEIGASDGKRTEVRSGELQSGQAVIVDQMAAK